MKHADAFVLLTKLDAPAHLVRHAQLVLEAANVLIAKLPIDDFVDIERVRIGAVIHDAGKALFQNELHEPGAKHESAGREALLELGVSDRYAIICETHADWRSATSLDELMITLADKLWKGKRVHALEEMFIEKLSSAHDCKPWDLFSLVDGVFEEVANGADERLRRSLV